MTASWPRVGGPGRRNVRYTLNTQTLLTGLGRVVVTADHVGVWDFSDPNQENEWLAKAWGSQMELRAIQKRNRRGDPGAEGRRAQAAPGVRVHVRAACPDGEDRSCGARSGRRAYHPGSGAADPGR